MFFLHTVLQILRFLKPNQDRNHGKVVAIYLPGAFVHHPHPNPQKLKQAIKIVGQNNVPLDFLMEGSVDTIIRPRANGHKKKCAVIPHLVLPEELLGKLYQGNSYKHTFSAYYHNLLILQLLG